MYVREIAHKCGIALPVGGQRDERFFFEEDFFFDGTLAPERRASERPMAMACLRLVTFLPERPLRRVPRLRLCMARLTFLEAFLPYFAIEVPFEAPWDERGEGNEWRMPWG